MNVWSVAEIRSRYTDSQNRCRSDIGDLANIAIAHDIATLCGEIERLRAALTRYGKHDSSGMSDQPGCQITRMGGGLCTCGLDDALRPKSGADGVLTITRDVTTVSPNFRVTARVMSSVCGKPMPDGKGAGQCINVPGHEGECDDMPL